ncbi:RNA polymerase-associated protein rtf1 [Haplosporangium sp. Z 767]|nr:RNA polymerase-associated protein rtf1 [Haplosporangium sp. Z 11]KAF9192622.1 RNA polymerase-associated protein rtf1 [Haplosporangium sp. Z 767]
MSNAADVILRLLANSASDSNKSRRRRRSRDSSDEEISEAEMSDRSDDQEDVGDEDDEGPVDEYDAEFYGDANDRAKLMAMTEVQREQILFERAKQRTVLLDHRQVVKRLKRQEEASRGSRKSGSTSRDSARRSGRSKDSKIKTDLKKSQEKKRSRQSHSRSPEPSRKHKRSADYDDKSDSASSEEDADYESEPEKKKSSKGSSRKPATIEDLNSIRLGRDQIEKWLYSPFFRKTAEGCFVRLSLSANSYRIAEVVAVNKQTKIYQVGKTMTNLTLTLKHGRAEKSFPVDYISNSSFTSDEYRRFEITLRAEKVDMPTLDQVERKRKDIEHAKEYILSAKEVEEIIELKKQMKQGRLNPIVHRTILEQQKMTQSLEEAEETERQLRELRELRESELAQKDQRSEKLDIWAKLNERNRKLNRTAGREAEERQAKEKKMKGMSGKDLDPFARRKTTPRLIYGDMSTPGTPTEKTDSAASSPPLTGANTPVLPTSTPTAQTVSAAPAMPQASLFESIINSNKDDFDIEIDMDDI